MPLHPQTRFIDIPGEYKLELGGSLPSVRIAFRTWGRLSSAADNCIVVCHALTGSADCDSWWPGMVGPGRAIDPETDFVVCANILGSCYGSTGPTEPRDETGTPWGPDFPAITVRDVVGLQIGLVRSLGVRRVRLVLGGSLGGMQVLEWALMAPDLVEAIVPIAIGGRHSAWCIGWSEAQRQAILADPRWRGGRYPTDDPPAAGLAVARMIGMCTYRSRPSFERRFGRREQAPGVFAVESYLRYQGEKLVRRFDANTYLTLTRAMDTHDVSRGRGEYEAVLRSITQPALVVTIPSDCLYPTEEQRELAGLMPNATLAPLDSDDGHDGFLIRTDELSAMVRKFRPHGC